MCRRWEGHLQYRSAKFLLAASAGAAAGWFAYAALHGDKRGLRGDIQTAVSSAELDSPHPSLIAATPSVATRPKVVSQSTVALSGSAEPVRKLADTKAIDSSTHANNVAIPAHDTQDQLPITQDGNVPNSLSVSCTFGTGYSASWPNEKLSPGTASWQGGPIYYDSFDTDAGTARMIGVLTGSQNGESGVTVVSTDSGLYLYGVAANGTSTMTTIFGADLNATGHFNAVMAYHGVKLQFHESAQFYGTCDTRR